MRRHCVAYGAVVLSCGLAALAGGGCSFGAHVLEKTHGPYNQAMRRVEEEQLLRNIILLRYNECPLNLNVTSIAAQYELSSQAEARPFFLAPNPASNDSFKTFTSILPDFLVGGANRPTVTLDPADGGEAVRQFLTPISADTMIFLTQTSWPVSTVLRLWVERINGVPNAVTTSGPARSIVPDFARFQRIAELFQEGQDRELATVRAEEEITEIGAPLAPDAMTAAAHVEAAKAGLEYRRSADGKSWSLVRKERRLGVELAPGVETNPELAELDSLLNLVPGRRRYEIVTAARGNSDPAKFPVPPGNEVCIVPRSSAQVLFYLGSGIELPPEHIAAGLVHLPVDQDGRVIDAREITRGLFEVRICHGHKPPATAFVAVRYRGWWYYIDDRDSASKATFTLVQELTRLDFARQRLGSGPVLTLPAGR
jgi:hypothetical protein